MKSGLLASGGYGGGGFACLVCRLGGVRHDETRRQLEINCAEGGGEKRGGGRGGGKEEDRGNKNLMGGSFDLHGTGSLLGSFESRIC